MKKLMLSLVLLATVSFTFSGCSEAAKIAKDPLGYLAKQPWVLSSLMGNSALGDLFSGQLPSLNIDPSGALSGFTGCNNFTGGELDLKDGFSLDTDAMAMTKKACPGNGESKFIDALSQVTNMKVDPGLLTFLGENGSELLKFKPQE